MIKCQKCGSELFYLPTRNNQIVLICSNNSCNFKSKKITLDPSFNHQISSNPSKNIKEKDTSEYGEDFNSTQNIQRCANHTIFQRKGKIKSYDIYCLDFSSRMDNEISYNNNFINNLKERINNEENLTKNLKNELLELINPPIS